jgi:hypothetical protein
MSYQPPTVPMKTQGSFQKQQTGGSHVRNPKTCFNYRETGHFIANCPYPKTVPSTFSNSMNGPKKMTRPTCTAPAKTQ